MCSSPNLTSTVPTGKSLCTQMTATYLESSGRALPTSTTPSHLGSTLWPRYLLQLQTGITGPSLARVQGVHTLPGQLFLLWSAPNILSCSYALRSALNLGSVLGLPTAPRKLPGSTTSLTFLDVEIDTVAEVFHLPAYKLARPKPTLEHWSRMTTATKHQLQSLISLLNHTTSVVPPPAAPLCGSS